MASPIAKIVRFRFAWVTCLLLAPLALSGLMAYAFLSGSAAGTASDASVLSLGITYTVFFVLSLIAIFFSLCLVFRWNLQFKLSFKFRPGMLIKYIFWLTGLFTLSSGILAYLVFIERKVALSAGWPVLVVFLACLLALILGMSVRYAVEEDKKTSKVCEFC